MFAMSRAPAVCLLLLLVLLLPIVGRAQAPPSSARNSTNNKLISNLKAERTSRLDLEVGGNLAGRMFNGSKAYLRRKDLEALPQVEFTVSNDANFPQPAKVRGVELGLLAKELAVDGERALVVAESSDYYRGFYPQAYREAHKPVLVLQVNGQPPSGWPKGKGGNALGPYLITHENFVPGYKVLAHEEEPQIPWGVVRLEFEDEKAAFGAIAPRGAGADNSNVQSGYRIAQQNCLRCHANSDEHTKGTITWSAMAIMAARSPQQFAAYVKDPTSFSANSEMPPNPEYDDATLQALIDYFSTFAPAETK
jgi:mono/diheme cytochrome c family protein